MYIKCAIFDADGTLLDSMPMWRNITYQYARDKGLTVPENLHETLNRLSMEQCAVCYQELGAPGSVHEIVQELIDYAHRGYEEQVPPKPCAPEFLKLLHENGVCVAVATASHAHAVKAACVRCGMAPYIDLFLSCAQVGKSKEHPDIFLQCAEYFHASAKESVVFEDSAYALLTAKKAGFATVAVEDEISLHSESGPESKEGLQTLSDRYITSFQELLFELSSLGEDDPLSRILGAKDQAPAHCK